MTRNLAVRSGWAIVGLGVLLASPATGQTVGGSKADAKATIRTTSHGVFHVVADDYTGAGFGVGYAQASEAICDIANRVVTVNAQRSLVFGPDQRTGDFYSNPKNLESDFFWQRIHDAGIIERELQLAAPLGPSDELRQMIRGFVAGYNRYLEVTGVAKLPDARCRGKAWVRPINERDLYLRAMGWNLFQSGMLMMSQIVAAAPPGGAASKVGLMDRLIQGVVTQGVGSNMIALGGDATDNGQGMLFANPHWTWYGPDRWMEMQITIPGKLNVMGMQTMGLPVVQTGFNEHVAWAGTTSMPRRYTIQKLTLGRTPTSYLVDGVEHSMLPRVVRIRARGPSGAIETREHTFWETKNGLMVVDPAFTWTSSHAYEMRDVGYTFRWLSQQLRLNAATSAEDLSASGKQFMAIGWRNLSAADDQGNVFYGDRTAVPAVPNELITDCQVAGMSERVLVLDGSRSTCQWRTIPGAPVAGIFSAEQLPQLHRRDYVEQSNDTHWLNNLRQPLEGYPQIMGAERTARTLRTRNGLLKIENRLAGIDGYPGNRFSLNLLRTLTMNNRVYSADIWLDDVVRFCRLQHDARVVSACHILSTWDRSENIDSPGALLWRHFGQAIEAIDPRGELAVIPFDVKDPLHTPSGLKTSDPRVRTALDRAIAKLTAAHIPLDATLRNYQFAEKNGQRIPISGGQSPGQFNTVFNDWIDGKGYSPISGGSTFIMWMQFTPNGPVGESILTFSQSPNAQSGYFADQTRMWSERRTKKMLFTEADVLRDPNLRTMTICSGSGCE